MKFIQLVFAVQANQHDKVSDN